MEVVEVEDEVEASGEAVVEVEASTEEGGVEVVEASVEVEVEGLEEGEEGGVARTSHTTSGLFFSTFFSFFPEQKIFTILKHGAADRKEETVKELAGNEGL